MPPHQPGQPLPRGYQHYNPYQELCWQALDTVYQAHYHGYGETRQPTPGRVIDPIKYLAWREKFDRAWASEAQRDQETRGLTGQELGENAMRHLYERFSRADSLRQQGYNTQPYEP